SRSAAPDGRRPRACGPGSAAGEPGGLPDRRRGAEEDALLAAAQLTFVLGERGHLDVTHARLDRAEHGRKDRVLHLAAAPDQADLLLTLDRLEAIDEVGGVDDARSGQALLEPCDESVRHAAGPDETDRAVATFLEHIERAVGVIVVGVVH